MDPFHKPRAAHRNGRTAHRLPRTVPGPQSRRLARRLRRVESRNITYASKEFPVFWESASGARVRDVDGNAYLDLTSAFAVSSLGHNHPAVNRALKSQADRLVHGMGDVHPAGVKVRLLERLAKLAPGNLEVTILSSTGAEAVESALKTARLATGKAGVLCFGGGYHGLTYGALSVTGRRDFWEPFADQLTRHNVTIGYPDSLRGPSEEEVLESVETVLRRRRAGRAKAIGAIIVEPVQGRGGARVPKASFLREVKALARRYGALLIADEVFTGFGRTGTLFACERSGVVPDLLCVGKAMANGFPISACIGSRRIMDAWPASDGEAIHTSTFLGHPLGCAMALAATDEIVKRRLSARADRLGAWWLSELQAALKRHPNVGEVRGQGLLIGVELVKDRETLAPDRRRTARMVEAGLKAGLLLLSGGNERNVLVLTPPLTIARSDLREATGRLHAILNK